MFRSRLATAAVIIVVILVLRDPAGMAHWFSGATHSLSVFFDNL